MKFTAHYSGHNVCAPARCVLMSGRHPGHGFIRDNRGGLGGEEGQTPVPAGTCALPLSFKAAGYATGAFGKWGLGPVGSSGEPGKQGFDRFYGYNCQAVAHNFYPTHLWSDAEKVALRNPKFPAHAKLPDGADVNDPKSYAAFSGSDFAPDLITDEALKFVRANQAKPFFLFYPTTLPHLALQVPEDSLREYEGKFPETPYPGGKGYLPHRTPRAAYAAMITRMDAGIGKVMALIAELKLREDTIVVFTSDNGPLYDGLGGTDDEFFQSAGGLRGRKGSFYEGGFRVPCLVTWPGQIKPGSTSARITGFEDWLPTLLELAGEKARIPAQTDGISFAATLRGQPQPERPFLYRESPGYQGQAVLRVGDWKLLGRSLHPGPRVKQPQPVWELYNLAEDAQEKNDLAAAQPERVKQMLAQLRASRVKSEEFPLRALDAP
jgi:arylsulfatase A